MNIRRALEKDIGRLGELLLEVCHVHAVGRPDIFKDGKRKYQDSDLKEMIKNEKTPIFVAVDDDDFVLAYAFCISKITEENDFMHEERALYIDDLCVDEKLRSTHIGSALFEYVKAFAKDEGFSKLTLNVWSFNKAAVGFYESRGMTVLKSIMELNI